MKMIDVEIAEIEVIEKELKNNAISISDIDNRLLRFNIQKYRKIKKTFRLEEEDDEVAELSVADLTRTTTIPTTTTTRKPSQGKVIRYGCK